MHETKIECRTCKRWVGRLPYVLENMAKSEQMATDAGWFGFFCTNFHKKRGRRIWYCPECAKKTTVKEMMDSI